MCCAFGGLKWLDSIFRGFISIVASTLLRSGPSVSIFRDDTPWLYGAQSTLFHGPELSLRLTFFLSKAGSKHSKFGVFGCTPSLVCKLAALPRSFSVFHSPKLTFWGDWQFLLPFLPFRFVHFFLHFPCFSCLHCQGHWDAEHRQSATSWWMHTVFLPSSTFVVGKVKNSGRLAKSFRDRLSDRPESCKRMQVHTSWMFQNWKLHCKTFTGCCKWQTAA